MFPLYRDDGFTSSTYETARVEWPQGTDTFIAQCIENDIVGSVNAAFGDVYHAATLYACCNRNAYPWFDNVYKRGVSTIVSVVLEALLKH